MKYWYRVVKSRKGGKIKGDKENYLLVALGLL